MRRFRAYAQLAKLYIFDQYFGIAICWSLLPDADRLDGRSVGLLAVCLVAVMAAMAAAVALDDVKGFRDGSDLVNYSSSESAGLRTATRKPLLAGTLTEREAIRFAFTMAVLAVSLTVAAYGYVGWQPWWLPLAGTALFGSGVQYSYGIGFSYRYLAAEEVILVLCTGGIVFLPYTLVTGHSPALVFVQALLFGVWMLQVSVFSNTHDVVGDRQVGRSTAAARFSEQGNNAFIVSVFVAGWIVLAFAVAAGHVPGLALVALVPYFVVHGAQLRHGIGRHDPLRARTLGLYGYRYAIAVVIVSNLLVSR